MGRQPLEAPACGFVGSEMSFMIPRVRLPHRDGVLAFPILLRSIKDDKAAGLEHCSTGLNYCSYMAVSETM